MVESKSTAQLRHLAQGVLWRIARGPLRGPLCYSLEAVIRSGNCAEWVSCRRGGNCKEFELKRSCLGLGGFAPGLTEPQRVRQVKCLLLPRPALFWPCALSFGSPKRGVGRAGHRMGPRPNRCLGAILMRLGGGVASP